MKKMRRLIPAIAMLLVSAVMLSTASFAWFTISSEAKAEGMTVSAMAASSLLIVNATDGEGKADGSFLTTNGVATFTTKATNLAPATHDDGQLGEDVTSTYGLVYISNAAEAIDPATGNVKTDAEADWADAVNSDAATYYMDYVVLLGASGEAKEGTLTAKLSTVATSLPVLHNAVAIDFIVDDDYMTTLWLKDAGTVFEIGDVTVPVAVSTDDAGVTEETGDSLEIIMRVYFDGDLQNGTEAYVRDAYATDAECGFNVLFAVN